MTGKAATVLFWAILIAMPLAFGVALWWLFFFFGVLGSGGVVLILILSFAFGRKGLFKGWENWQFITGLSVAVLLAVVVFLGFCLSFLKGVEGAAVYCGSMFGYLFFYLVTRMPFFIRWTWPVKISIAALIFAVCMGDAYQILKNLDHPAQKQASSPSPQNDLERPRRALVSIPF